MTSLNKNIVFEQAPNIKIDTKEVFGVQCEFIVQGFNEKNDYVPKIDENYKFDPVTTKSILAGFSNDRRVLIQLHLFQLSLFY